MIQGADNQQAAIAVISHAPPYSVGEDRRFERAPPRIIDRQIDANVLQDYRRHLFLHPVNDAGGIASSKRNKHQETDEGHCCTATECPRAGNSAQNWIADNLK